MVVQIAHIRHYASETLTIRNRNDSILKGKNTMLTLNLLVVPILIVPLLAILSICGGNIMLTFFVVLTLIPAGYIFAKFF
jgi:hypothetical protein